MCREIEPHYCSDIAMLHLCNDVFFNFIVAVVNTQLLTTEGLELLVNVRINVYSLLSYTLKQCIMLQPSENVTSDVKSLEINN